MCFFLHPDTLVREQIAPEILGREYEVYLFQDSEAAAAMAVGTPVVAVFVSLSGDASQEQWGTLATALMPADGSGATRLGILASAETPQWALEPEGLAGGVARIDLKASVQSAVDALLRELEATGERGRRRYVRAHCQPEAVVFTLKDRPEVTGTVNDISSNGMSCRFADQGPAPAGNVWFQIELRSGPRKCLVAAQIVSQDPRNQRTIAMFGSTLEGKDKLTLRAIVLNALQEDMARRIEEARSLRKR